ncbi:MAG: energy-coupling factor transporter transmembrane protein EcfT [Candidatus Odinarchaeota archaeon]|nr:energy-coupling factor transporter transmembrane protein EcfT [Candidatus Odinarchaeota archaeon]
MSVPLMYIKKESFMHSLDPRTKMFIITVSIIPPIIFAYPLLSFFVFLVSIFWAILGKITRTYLWTLTKTVGWVLLLLFLVQGFFNPVGQTVLFTVAPGIALKREGAIFALVIISRLLAIFGIMYVFTMTTHPSDLLISLSMLGMPYKIVYALFSTINIVPLVSIRMETIKEAQKSRGLIIEGNPIRKILAFIPLITPLLLGSIIEAQERAMALEARGFSAPVKKTFIRELKIRGKDKGIMFLAVVLYGLLIVSGVLYPTFYSWLPF